MDLILWRHAQAEDLRPGLDDLDRPLTAKGREQAKKMARWLNKHLPTDTRILVSPALRTRQTADALKRNYEIVATISPDASAKDLILAAQWPGAKTPILIVGHQPTLGNLASQLLCGKAQDWSIKKGAVWWISASPTNPAVLRAVINPEFL